MSLSHQKAQDYLQAAADGLLDAKARVELERHLDDCPQCRTYAAQLAQLETHLSQSFHNRWSTPTRDQSEFRRTIHVVRGRLGKRESI